MRRPVALVLLFALAETAAAQAVHVVGTRAGPGVEFTSVQVAVDAAGHGDVLLLLPGDHAGPVTVSKGLVMLGLPAPDGSAPSLQELTIDVPFSTRPVVLRGIQLASPSQSSSEDRAALRVLDSAVLALIEDSWAEDLPGQDAQVDDSAGAVFVRCAFSGDAGASGSTMGSGSEPGPALYCGASQALFECSFVGGPGAAAKQTGLFTIEAQSGGFGVISPAATLASQVSIEGGSGGSGFLTSGGACIPPGNGGPALYVAAPLQSDELDLLGGPSGLPGSGCPTGSEGELLVTTGVGSIVSLPSGLPSLHVQSLLEPGHLAQLHYDGPPLQPVLLLVSAEPGLQWLPGALGVLAVSSDFRLLSLGMADGAGVIDMSVSIPAGVLAGAKQGTAIAMFLQAVAVTPAGLVLSNPTSATILELP